MAETHPQQSETPRLPQRVCPACGGTKILREDSARFQLTGIAECADCGEPIYCPEDDDENA